MADSSADEQAERPGSSPARSPTPADPEAHVQGALRRLGAEPPPEVPREVTDRVLDALRGAPPVTQIGYRPKHVVTRATVNYRAAAGLGLAAVAAIAGVGAYMLLRSPDTPAAEPERIRSITVSTAPTFPLSEAEIVGLLSRPADLAALSDPVRRAACLTGLGYPDSAPVLGARPVDADGGPAVLLVLAAKSGDDLAALVVRPTCAGDDAAPVAETIIARP